MRGRRRCLAGSIPSEEGDGGETQAAVSRRRSAFAGPCDGDSSKEKVRPSKQMRLRAAREADGGSGGEHRGKRSGEAGRADGAIPKIRCSCQTFIACKVRLLVSGKRSEDMMSELKPFARASTMHRRVASRCSV